MMHLDIVRALSDIFLAAVPDPVVMNFASLIGTVEELGNDVDFREIVRCRVNWISRSKTCFL